MNFYSFQIIIASVLYLDKIEIVKENYRAITYILSS